MQEQGCLWGSDYVHTLMEDLPRMYTEAQVWIQGRKEFNPQAKGKKVHFGKKSMVIDFHLFFFIFLHLLNILYYIKIYIKKLQTPQIVLKCISKMISLQLIKPSPNSWFKKLVFAPYPKCGDTKCQQAAKSGWAAGAWPGAERRAQATLPSQEW